MSAVGVLIYSAPLVLRNDLRFACFLLLPMAIGGMCGFGPYRTDAGSCLFHVMTWIHSAAIGYVLAEKPPF